MAESRLLYIGGTMRFLLASSLIISVVACGKNETDQVAQPIQINSDADILATRMKIEAELLELSDSNPSLILKKSKEFTLTLVATVTAPIVNGLTTQATDISFKSNLALVSYNYAGETHTGAIDAIDVSDEDSPKLNSQITFANHDINAVTSKGSQAYLTGATSSGSEPAFVAKVEINKEKFEGVVTTLALPSYAGTDVVVHGDIIYTTTGNSGGVYAIDESKFTIKNQAEIADARSVDWTGNSIDVLSGNTAKIHTFNKDLELQGTALEIGGATIAESKSTIDLGSETAIVALNDGGTKLVCREDGKIVGTIPAVTVAGLSSTKTVTNAAYMSSGLLFTANGEAGVYVYYVSTSSKTVSKCKDRSIELQGSIDFGSKLSANHVYYKSGYLFVADGLGGLKIVAVDSEKK